MRQFFGKSPLHPSLTSIVILGLFLSLGPQRPQVHVDPDEDEEVKEEDDEEEQAAPRQGLNRPLSNYLKNQAQEINREHERAKDDAEIQKMRIQIDQQADEKAEAETRLSPTKFGHGYRLPEAGNHLNPEFLPEGLSRGWKVPHAIAPVLDFLPMDRKLDPNIKDAPLRSMAACSEVRSLEIGEAVAHQIRDYDAVEPDSSRSRLEELDETYKGMRPKGWFFGTFGLTKDQKARRKHLKSQIKKLEHEVHRETEHLIASSDKKADAISACKLAYQEDRRSYATEEEYEDRVSAALCGLAHFYRITYTLKCDDLLNNRIIRKQNSGGPSPCHHGEDSSPQTPQISRSARDFAKIAQAMNQQERRPDPETIAERSAEHELAQLAATGDVDAQLNYARYLNNVKNFRESKEQYLKVIEHATNPAAKEAVEDAHNELASQIWSGDNFNSSNLEQLKEISKHYSSAAATGSTVSMINHAKFTTEFYLPLPFNNSDRETNIKLAHQHLDQLVTQNTNTDAKERAMQVFPELLTAERLETVARTRYSRLAPPEIESRANTRTPTKKKGPLPPEPTFTGDETEQQRLAIWNEYIGKTYDFPSQGKVGMRYPLAQVLHANNLLAYGKFKDAIPYFEENLKDPKWGPTAVMGLADAKIQLGNLPEAEKIYKEHTTESSDPFLKYTYADFLKSKVNRLAEAKPIFQSVLNQTRAQIQAIDGKTDHDSLENQVARKEAYSLAQLCAAQIGEIQLPTPHRLEAIPHDQLLAKQNAQEAALRQQLQTIGARFPGAHDLVVTDGLTPDEQYLARVAKVTSNAQIILDAPREVEKLSTQMGDLLGTRKALLSQAAATGDLQAKYNLAGILLYQNETAPAVQTFIELSNQTNKPLIAAAASHRLALQYMSINQDPGPIDTLLLKALSIVPASIQYQLTRADFLVRQKNWTAAKEILDRLSTSPDPKIQNAVLYYRQAIQAAQGGAPVPPPISPKPAHTCWTDSDGLMQCGVNGPT